jgi:hypothetical protein
VYHQYISKAPESATKCWKDNQNGTHEPPKGIKRFQERKLVLTVPEHLSSPQGFCEIRFTRSLIFGVLFCRSLLLLFNVIVLASDYPLDIFKHFALQWNLCIRHMSFPHPGRVKDREMFHSANSPVSLQ